LNTRAPAASEAEITSVISEGWPSSSEIVITFSLRKIHVGSVLELLVHVLDLILIDGNLRGLEDWGLNESEVRVTIYIDKDRRRKLTRQVCGEAR
jgi:hypothetical protein